MDVWSGDASACFDTEKFEFKLGLVEVHVC